MSDKELEYLENSADTDIDPPDDSAESAAVESPQEEEETASDEPESAQNSLYRPNPRNSRRGRNTRRNALIGTSVFGVLAAFIAMLLFVGSLKAIHFATILRSSGFATSQLVVRQAFSEIAYSDWVTQNDTTELPKSSLLDKIRGQDMRKIQKKLVDDGTFKYTADSAGNVNGFELNGEKVVFDDLAKLYGKESWKDMTFREKMGANKFLTDQVKVGIGETFNAETRGFRNGFWKGFRESTGIKMTRFRDLTRDKLGKPVVDESKNNDKTRLQEERADITGSSGGVSSDIPEAEEGAEAINKIEDDAASQGRRVQAKEAFDIYLQGKDSGIIAFEEGMSKASDAVFISTLYCMGHDLSHTSDRLNDEMEKRMARFGHQQQTTLDQIKTGDVTPGDVTFANMEWNGNDKTPDASASALYQQNYGKDAGNAGLDGAPRMNVALPFLDWLKPVDMAIRTGLSQGLNHAPLIGGAVDSAIDTATTKACGVVMNPYTQGGILVVDLGVTFFTGGLSKVSLTTLKAVPVFAGFAGLGKLIEWYIGQIASGGIAGNEVGADRYAASAISTDYLDSQTSRGVTYASPQTTEEASTTKTAAMAEMQDYYNNSGIKNRYFALSNPNSLLGQTVATLPTSTASIASTIANFPHTIASVFSHSFTMFGSILGGSRVFAAGKQDVAKQNDYFGVNQWGWTPEEQAILQNTNPFDNAADVEQDMQRDPDYYQKLEGCYDSNKLLYKLAQDPDCSASALRTTRALSWRVYKLQLFAANQISSEGLNEN